MARGTSLSRPFTTEGQTEVTYEYYTVGRRRSPAFVKTEDGSPSEDEHVDLDADEDDMSDDENMFQLPVEVGAQPRLPNSNKFVVQDGMEQTVFRKTQVSHQAIVCFHAFHFLFVFVLLCFVVLLVRSGTRRSASS